MRIELHLKVNKPGFIPDILTNNTDISKQKIKQAMQKGAVWLEFNNRTRKIRKAKTEALIGSKLHFYYDDFILSETTKQPILVQDLGQYSVWHKPAGMLSQGSKFADHCAINRWLEVNFRKTYLVHRLDKDASGLMIFAHNKKMAAKLSEIFQNRMIDKFYQAGVMSDIPDKLPLEINQSLAGKSAKTIILKSWQESNINWVLVKIETGRKHQIRQHLSFIGLPILGDKLYGSKQNGRLLLQAQELSFVCPLSSKKVLFKSPKSLSNIYADL